jgi:hypothetical protein
MYRDKDDTENAGIDAFLPQKLVNLLTSIQKFLSSPHKRDKLDFHRQRMLPMVLNLSKSCFHLVRACTHDTVKTIEHRKILVL